MKTTENPSRKGFSTGCSSRGVSSRNLESVFKMVESCCHPPWFEGWCHSDHYYCWGVYKLSAVPGASRGVVALALRAWMWGQVMMGLIKHPADTHCCPGTSKMLTHCSSGSLTHRQSSPWVREVLGLKHPQRVPWRLGLGEEKHGTHRKGGLCGGTSSKMNEMLYP